MLLLVTIKSQSQSPFDTHFAPLQYEPGNSCYCPVPPCQPSGVLDLGVGCPFPQASNPVYMSWPHFLHGDPALRTSIDFIGGLEEPQADLHAFILDVQPDWGITLRARAAFQFNVLLERNEFPWTENISDKVSQDIIRPFLTSLIFRFCCPF